jgi:hypothetical protein
MNLLEQIDPYVGKYFSMPWVKRKILRQDEEEQEQMKKEMDADEINGDARPVQGSGSAANDASQNSASWGAPGGGGPAMPSGTGQPGGPDGPPQPQEAGGAGQ